MTTGLGKTMTYDAENRVKTATRNGVTTTYVYGADGARLKRTVSGATTLTIGPIEVRNYKASSGQALLLYPTPWFRLEGGKPAFFHQDQVDSIQLITNDTGLVASTSTYKPFGEKRTDSAGIIATETKGFVGERYDSRRHGRCGRWGRQRRNGRPRRQRKAGQERPKRSRYRSEGQGDSR